MGDSDHSEQCLHRLSITKHLQGAVGIELWSMSDNILFDNLIVTDNVAEANQLAAETYDLKIMKLEKGQVRGN